MEAGIEKGEIGDRGAAIVTVDFGLSRVRRIGSGRGMNLESLARPSVLTQPVYEPGKPIEYVPRELGLDPDGIIKMASHENPFGPSPLALAAAKRALEQG